MSRKRKGWFKKAKAKWITKNIHCFTIGNKGFLDIKCTWVNGHELITTYYGQNKPEYYYKIKKMNFSDAFVFCQGLKKDFDFTFSLKQF